MTEMLALLWLAHRTTGLTSPLLQAQATLQQAGVTNDVGVDPWADWTGHTKSTSQLQAHSQAQPSPRLDAGSKEASLLDM